MREKLSITSGRVCESQLCESRICHGAQADTLRSSFDLDYPCYEILFCVAAPNDPVLPLVKGLMAAHPNIAARLLIGDDRVSANPKLNNVVKGWRAASHSWIVIADSNVLMPA